MQKVKVKGQSFKRQSGSNRTDKQMDGGHHITSRANAVSNDKINKLKHHDSNIIYKLILHNKTGKVLQLKS